MLLGDRVRLLVRARKAGIVLGLLILLGLVICIVQRGRDLPSLAVLGYPGVTILMFLSASTVLFPAPGFAAVLAAGVVWNPLLVGIAAGVGAGSGEVSGYLLGAGGSVVLNLKEDKRWQRAHRWLDRHGLLAIVALAAIPNPVFDVLGLVAGSLSYPVRSFWLGAVLGNTIKYVALAYLSSGAATWWLSR